MGLTQFEGIEIDIFCVTNPPAWETKASPSKKCSVGLQGTNEHFIAQIEHKSAHFFVQNQEGTRRCGQGGETMEKHMGFPEKNMPVVAGPEIALLQAVSCGFQGGQMLKMPPKRGITWAKPNLKV